MAGPFKAYDVRGVYGKELNKDLGYKIGRAFGSWLGAGKTIAVGRDDRPHSPELQAALVDGILDAGVNVCDLGLCTTPMTYFACFSEPFDGSVMVTASHNPGEYNGLKFCRENAIPVGYVDGLDEIEKSVRAGLPEKAGQRGQRSEKSFLNAYLEFLKPSMPESTFNFAVDCGNGMGGYLMPHLLAGTNHEVQRLYWDLDFSFPNHAANPLDFSTLEDLTTAVRSNDLDFGVAFDGDADRCFLVDDLGEVVPADILTTLLAIDTLQKKGPTSIIYDVRSSLVLSEEVEKLGGTPVLCRVGHSFMKSKLREKNGWFGGELAGHFYYREFSFADSAMLTMLKVMTLLHESGKKLSELVAPLKKYAPSGEINFVTNQADDIINDANQRFPGGKLCDIDGIRLDFNDWWFCLRKSNTEPLLRLVLEAKDQEKLMLHQAEIVAWLTEWGAERHEGH